LTFGSVTRKKDLHPPAQGPLCLFFIVTLRCMAESAHATKEGDKTVASTIPYGKNNLACRAP
jgi:hypothetical protein